MTQRFDLSLTRDLGGVVSRTACVMALLVAGWAGAAEVSATTAAANGIEETGGAAAHQGPRGLHKTAPLSDEQRAALRQAREVFAPELTQARAGVKRANQALQEATRRSADERELQTLARDLGEAEAAQHWVRAKLNVAQRNLLTPEQREIMDKRGSRKGFHDRNDHRFARHGMKDGGRHHRDAARGHRHELRQASSSAASAARVL